jgi:Methylmalonyl-CoA mutase
MAALNLLSEFPPISTEAWERAIRNDLKGADYADKLIWRSPEGIDVKPYYRAEDLAGLEFLNAAPGEFPYVRGTSSAGGWRIREEIDAVDLEEANSAARCAIAAGAEEITFCHTTICNASDLGILLANLGEIPVHFENIDCGTARLLIDRLNKRQHAVTVSGGLNWSADPDLSAEVIAKSPVSFVPFTIHVEDFQDSGATAVEEV